MNTMRQSAYLVVNSVTVNSFATFNCTQVGRASAKRWAHWLRLELVSSVAWSYEVQLVVFFCFGVSVVIFHILGTSNVTKTLFLSSPHSPTQHRSYS